jgi:hypothetical protein
MEQPLAAARGGCRILIGCAQRSSVAAWDAPLIASIGCDSEHASLSWPSGPEPRQQTVGFTLDAIAACKTRLIATKLAVCLNESGDRGS